MRTVKKVLNLHDGQIIEADDYFNRTEEEVFLERRLLEEAAQRKEKTLVCAICQQPLKIRGDRNGSISIHFAHLYDSGDCPIKTGKKYSKEEILRMMFNGVKESHLHIKLKNAIASIISRDDRFSKVKVDEVFKSEGLSKEWKKPDVSTEFNSEKVVFEVQLSTTFLSVIVQRELFYRENSTYIMWLFSEFNTDIEAQKFTEKDIIYSNNNNAFVINDETIERSAVDGKFYIYCYYRKPVASESGYITFEWVKELITFDDIKYDNESYKVYYFDSKKEKESLQQELLNRFNLEFLELLVARHSLSYEEKRNQLTRYEELFSRKGIDYNPGDDSLHKILDAILSLKRRQMIGYNYTNYISLANIILEYRKDYAELFLLALKHFGVEEIVLSEDRKGTFKNKLENFHSQRIVQNSKYIPLFRHVFPELPI